MSEYESDDREAGKRPMIHRDPLQFVADEVQVDRGSGRGRGKAVLAMPGRRAGVIEISIPDLAAIIGARSTETLVAIEHAPARGVVRFTLEGGFLPECPVGAEAPIVDRA